MTTQSATTLFFAVGFKIMYEQQRLLLTYTPSLKVCYENNLHF